MPWIEDFVLIRFISLYFMAGMLSIDTLYNFAFTLTFSRDIKNRCRM
jgi:hypothetical protein